MSSDSKCLCEKGMELGCNSPTQAKVSKWVHMSESVGSVPQTVWIPIRTSESRWNPLSSLAELTAI